MGQAAPANDEELLICLERELNELREICDIGCRFAASLDLDELADMFFDVLNSRLQVDSFSILIPDFAAGELQSVAFYQSARLNKQIVLSINDEKSLIAKCFREGRIFVSDNGKEQNLKRLWGSNMEIMNSAVFVPLKVKDGIIGAYTVQSKRGGVYGEKELRFLENLQPHMAVAARNAIYCRGLKDEIAEFAHARQKLESEIIVHKRSQRDLQSAYEKLELISSIDSLTQISSRRDFEFRFVNMLENAEKNKNSVSVFMMDIDDFKLFNDTFGHLEGDEVLKSVAGVFSRELDVVGGLLQGSEAKNLSAHASG